MYDQSAVSRGSGTSTRLLETAFRIADPRVSSERRDLLERAGQLCTEPLLEPIPRYVPEAWNIRDLPDHAAEVLPGFDSRSVKLFSELISSGYSTAETSHFTNTKRPCSLGGQTWIAGHRHVGTGSGKTESFLLQ